jgi:hypothetical protein
MALVLQEEVHEKDDEDEKEENEEDGQRARVLFLGGALGRKEGGLGRLRLKRFQLFWWWRWWVSDTLCLSTSSALHFFINILFWSTTLLTSISLQMEYPLT